MSKTIFKTTQYPIQTLINDIDHGKIALPDIQRPFVWDTTKVRDLFDSIYRGYPVGYLLFWENVNDNNRKDIGTDKKESNAKSLIIDGQQRLTALFATIKGIPIIDANYKEKRIKIAFNPLLEKFEVSNVATDRDVEYITDISLLFQNDFSEYRFINEFIQRLKANKDTTQEQEEIISQNITHLRSILSYDFTILEIAENVDEETVASIFVRVNSKGVVLKQSDFVLTLLSVFWESGRKKIEDFSMQSNNPNSQGLQYSSFNHLIDVKPGEILRAIVGYGFNRGRMSDVYSLLRGRDFETREFIEELKQKRFNELEEYVSNGLDNTTWHDYINLIQSLGFKHSDLITSRTNFFYSYAFYLIGKYRFNIEFHKLERIVSRWFLMSALKSRYSGSSESYFESDLALIRNAKNGDEFISLLDSRIQSEITNDFWEITMPALLTSSYSKNPQWLVFIASQIRNNVDLLFSTKKISDLFDPVITVKKARLDKHHIFPKNYLNGIGIVEQTEQNQVANYLYLDYKTNIVISDNSPMDYFKEFEQYSRTDLETVLKNHALPYKFYELNYSEFLTQRKKLLSQSIRNYFESI
ncbi:MAG: DUF262 domain-containing protein [Candidatus Dojkabacteria bacterium]|nr:MAG: DUF262 domain-containing protein [Candidatus Dojkabacteria bacterium]